MLSDCGATGKIEKARKGKEGRKDSLAYTHRSASIDTISATTYNPHILHTFEPSDFASLCDAIPWLRFYLFFLPTAFVPFFFEPPDPPFLDVF